MTRTGRGGPWAAPCATSFRRSPPCGAACSPRARARSMRWARRWGGLISALEDQRSRGRLNGALTTCGIVAGANNLNQYQLDGEYAISELLAPGQDIKLTGFTVGPPTFSDSAASAAKLTDAAHAA